MTEVDAGRPGRKPAPRRTCPVCRGNGTVPKNQSDPRQGDKRCDNCEGIGELFTPWMTVPEAAVYTRRHPETVRHACAAGRLVAFQDCEGAPWFIHMDDADTWIRTRRGALRVIDQTA
jgi:hypothetical protein